MDLKTSEGEFDPPMVHPDIEQPELDFVPPFPHPTFVE
jgi:hypothetical protein